MNRNHFRPLPPLALTALLLTLSLGCDPTTPIPAPTSPLDPQALLRQSAQRVMALESGAFDLEHRQGATLLLPGVEMTRVYGKVEVPDKFFLTVEAQVSGTFAEAQIALVDGQAYMTNFITGQWQPAPRDALPFNFADLGNTLAGIIQAVRDPALVATEALEGAPAHRIMGKVKSEDLSALVPAAAEGFDVALELWVDETSKLPRQVLITGPVVATDTPDTVRVFTLDASPVTVEFTPPR